MKKQVIEHAGVPIGILVPEDALYRFIAGKFHVYQRNDRSFNSVSDVHLALDDRMERDAHARLAA